MQSDYSRPTTAATGYSSDRSFAYSVISNKFASTGEVLLLPKVNARRSIKFDKEMTGPKIMAVRETAHWLISNNNRVTDDLSKECRRLDDSYLKWYRKHFNEKKDVIEKVGNLIKAANREKTERCRSYQSCYKNMSTPASMRSKSRKSVTHGGPSTGGFFTTEMPEVEDVDPDQATKVSGDPAQEGEETTAPAEGSPVKEEATTAAVLLKNGAVKTSPTATEQDTSNHGNGNHGNGKHGNGNHGNGNHGNGNHGNGKHGNGNHGNGNGNHGNGKSALKNNGDDAGKSKEVRIVSPS